MGNEELIKTIGKFKEFLEVGTIVSDGFRWLGWIFVQGLAYLLDGLETVTNQVLLIKTFFQNPEIVAFVNSIRPFLYILLAFSLLYTGYLLIFQKKFNREGIAINLFIALIVIAILGTSMEKANEFTDEAIKAIGNQQLYGTEQGTLSENILSRNIVDLMEFDKTGWNNTKLDKPNTVPLGMIKGIRITEKFDFDRDELNISPKGQDISKSFVIWLGDKTVISKLDQGGLDYNNEYYYRYSPKWLTLITTIVVMAFTLFSIAYKLARLSYEMTFNYVLAIIIAPADIHDGQKTKKILQAILNTFMVIILIFLSMKIYMIGTAYLEKTLDGVAYLIAMIAFSTAVIDGPNIVERLFGIDAGLKKGLGVLAGAYAGGKMASGLGRSLANRVRKDDDKDKDQDKDKDGKNMGANKGQPTSSGEGESKSIHGEENTQKAEDAKGQQRKQAKVPSPHDHERVAASSAGQKASTGAASMDGSSVGSVAASAAMGAAGTAMGLPTGVTRPSGMNHSSLNTQSNGVSKTKVTDHATVRQDMEVASTQNTVQGSVTTSGTQSSGHSSNAPVTSSSSGVDTSVTSHSHSTATTKLTEHTTVRQDTEVTQGVQEVAATKTYERIRPKNYVLDKGKESIIEKMKNHRKDGRS